MNRSRGVKNILWGIIAQAITIGLGVIIPRLVLVNLGSEANGLLNSVGNILAYMALLEAGVGTATIQALYHPIAQDDKAEINRIMSATHYFYRRTGFIYLAIVLVLSAGYTLFVETELPRFQVLAVVLLSGLSGVLGYFFQGKLKLLLSAEGKGYISTNITTVCSSFVSICKAAVLVSGGNVVAVQTVYFVFNLVQLVVFLLYFRRHYAWLDFHADPDFSAISQKNAVLVHQISGLIFSNTDVIVLTFLTSLKVVSVYSMYAMIYGMVKSVAVTLQESYVYALGQSYTDRERFLRLYHIYELCTMAITFALFCIATVLMKPFLILYTAGVEDINYIDDYLPLLFAAFYLLHNGRAASSHVIDIAQHFKQTKWRSALEAAINLTSSIVLTYFFGIYGVLLGTILALLYRTNDMIIYAAKHVLNRSPLITYRRWGRNVLLFCVVLLITSRLQLNLSNYGYMVIYGVVLCCTVIPAYFLLNYLMEPGYMKAAFGIMKNLLSARLRRQKS